MTGEESYVQLTLLLVVTGAEVASIVNKSSHGTEPEHIENKINNGANYGKKKTYFVVYFDHIQIRSQYFVFQ